MPLAPGQILNNRYRIINLLGQGGMGAVYKAWDLNLSRQRAVKENLDVSPESQRQFEREAQILSDLTHPNLPKVIDYFIVPGQGQYLVMEFVEGEDLREKLQHAGRPLLESQVLDWMLQACAALQYLHSQSPPIIHRDIKPANIKITIQGKAMLVDFGIARVYDPNLSTTVGAKAITPGYSPIEQYGSGQHTSPASDIYALGATLYALLGRQTPPPAPDRNLGVVLPPLRSLNPTVTPDVEAVVMKAMALQLQDRFRSAAEFAAALSPAPLAAPAWQPPVKGAGPLAYRWIAGIIILILGVGFLLIAWANGIWPFGDGSPTETPTPSLETITPSTNVPPATTNKPPTETSKSTARVTDQPTRRTTTPINAVQPPRNPLPPVATIQGSIWRRPADDMMMVFIPAGDFQMGSPISDLGAEPNEKPQHTVALNAYWIDMTEITNAQYASCVAAGKCQPPPNSGSATRSSYFGDPQFADYPVINVSWDDAVSYCGWAGAKLPTEAEWEKAARGVDGRIYPWGDQPPTCQLANYSGCVDDTSAVQSYPGGASQYGAVDMAGNVWEWVQDWFSEPYDNNLPVSNPQGPPSGEYRVLRGGAWYDTLDHVRSAYRISALPGIRDRGFGFRCVISLY